MTRVTPIILVLLTVCGCSKQDAATLGRIGQRLHEQTHAALNNGHTGRLIKSLPLLQPPSGDSPPPDSGDHVPPRLQVPAEGE